eukprot:803372-Rhodomonas_salina.1
MQLFPFQKVLWCRGFDTETSKVYRLNFPDMSATGRFNLISGLGYTYGMPKKYAPLPDERFCYRLCRTESRARFVLLAQLYCSQRRVLTHGTEQMRFWYPLYWSCVSMPLISPCTTQPPRNRVAPHHHGLPGALDPRP